MISKNELTLYKVSDICSILEVGSEKVYKWIQSGQLKGFYCGRGYKVREEDLVDFVKRLARGDVK